MLLRDIRRSKHDKENSSVFYTLGVMLEIRCIEWRLCDVVSLVGQTAKPVCKIHIGLRLAYALWVHNNVIVQMSQLLVPINQTKRPSSSVDVVLDCH